MIPIISLALEDSSTGLPPMTTLAFLKLKKYANQLEWVEGTLVEDYSEEELSQKTLKGLEKAVDLEYFGQVFFPNS